MKNCKQTDLWISLFFYGSRRCFSRAIFFSYRNKRFINKNKRSQSLSGNSGWLHYFSSGNSQGKNQPDGILKGDKPFLIQEFRQGEVIEFDIMEGPDQNIGKECLQILSKPEITSGLISIRAWLNHRANPKTTSGLIKLRTYPWVVAWVKPHADGEVLCTHKEDGLRHSGIIMKFGPIFPYFLLDIEKITETAKCSCPSLLWDGLGRWANGIWRPYLKTGKTRRAGHASWYLRECEGGLYRRIGRLSDLSSLKPLCVAA